MIKDDKFNEFYIRYRDKIFNFIYYRTRDGLISEELMQETFMTLYETSYDFNSKTDIELKNITYKIARNKILTFMKNNKRRLDIFEKHANELYEDRISNPEEEFEKMELSKDVNDVLNRLTKDQKRTIILVKMRGMSYKQASRVLEKKQNEVRQLLHRGKEKTKKIITKEYPEIACRYKNAKKYMSIIILLVTTMITGIVYASVKIYKKINTSNTYTLKQRDAKRDESKANINRKEAENIIKNYLSALGIKEDNFDELKLTSYGLENKEIWSLLKYNSYKIDISSDNGELIYFNLRIDNNIVKNKNTNKNAKEYVKDIYSKLNFENKYNKSKFEENNHKNIKTLNVYYYSDEGNYADGIKITYYKNRVISVVNNSYFINNFSNIKISSDEAIKILKENYNVKSIEKIEISEDCNNTNIKIEDYEVENYIKEEVQQYNYDNIKFIWEITYNKDKKVSIDAESGEIITDNYNYEEKKD